MKAHWLYLKYVLRHKFYVYQEGRRVGVGRWQLLVHDLSKFRPDEWMPYALFFYGGPHPDESEIGYYESVNYGRGRSQQGRKAAFDVAWLKHIHRNPHHWQYWMLREDSGESKLIDIPYKYCMEMVADWAGAGRAIHGRQEVMDWYANNGWKMVMNTKSRMYVESILDSLYSVKEAIRG